MSIAAHVEAPSPAAEVDPDSPAGRLAVAAAWYRRDRPAIRPSHPVLFVAGPSGPAADELARSLEVDRRDLPVDEGSVPAGQAVLDTAADDGCDLAVLAVPELSRPERLPGTLAVIALLTDTEPVRVVPSAAGTGPAAWSELVAAVRDRRRRIRADRDAPDRLLEDLDDAVLAEATGVVVAAAARRIPVVLDGLGALAAGLVASAASWSMKGWLAAADVSTRPAAEAVTGYLRLEPLVAHGVATDDGVAGLLAVQALHTAAVLLD